MRLKLISQTRRLVVAGAKISGFESVFECYLCICLVNKPHFFFKHAGLLITLLSFFLCVLHMRRAESLLSSFPVERRLNSSARCQLFLQLCKHSLFVPFPVWNPNQDPRQGIILFVVPEFDRVPSSIPSRTVAQIAIVFTNKDVCLHQGKLEKLRLLTL